MKGNITHITFDFFGTLVDYTPGHFSGNKYQKAHQFLLKNNYVISYTDFESAFSDIFNQLEAKAKITNHEFHMHEVGTKFFTKKFGDVPSQIIEEFIEIYISEWNKGISFYPDIKNFLNKLKGKYELSIISNTHYPSLVQSNIDAMDIDDYFSHVVTSIEYGIRKPDVQIFHDTLRRFSVSPESVIHIGDSMHDDYEGATKAGLQSILIDPTRTYQGVVENRVDSIFDITL
jgi:putative hydrolase of the HAD superfamily